MIINEQIIFISVYALVWFFMFLYKKETNALKGVAFNGKQKFI